MPSDARARLLQPWQLHLLPWIVYILSIAAFVTAAFRPLCVYIVQRRQDSIFGIYGQANVIPRLFNHMRDLMHEVFIVLFSNIKFFTNRVTEINNRIKILIE